jgi:hypothetical protein
MRDKKYLKTEENDGIKMNIEVGNLLLMMTIIRNDMDEKQNVFFSISIIEQGKRKRM